MLPMPLNNFTSKTSDFKEAIIENYVSLFDKAISTSF